MKAGTLGHCGTDDLCDKAGTIYDIANHPLNPANGRNDTLAKFQGQSCSSDVPKILRTVALKGPACWFF